MKHIYLNLKRFDVPVGLGGVNRLAPVASWGRAIVEGTQQALKQYDPAGVNFTMYLPEAHLPAAAAALCENSPVKLGCQGVYRDDTALGGNFGAFTTNRPAAAAKALGCESVLIGHCEERADKLGILAEAGVTGAAAAQAEPLAQPRDAGGHRPGPVGAVLYRGKERGAGRLAGGSGRPAGHGPRGGEQGPGGHRL